jgi:hypothetical protein
MAYDTIQAVPHAIDTALADWQAAQQRLNEAQSTVAKLARQLSELEQKEQQDQEPNDMPNTSTLVKTRSLSTPRPSSEGFSFNVYGILSTNHHRTLINPQLGLQKQIWGWKQSKSGCW